MNGKVPGNGKLAFEWFEENMKATITPIYAGSPDQRWGHISYAQHGDDFALINIFELMGIANPSYLDIGAHHPEHISNTKLLYERGSRGVNIEANPNLIKAFEERRPEDMNVNIGVGPVAGLLPFYMHNETSGRNTFDIVERDIWIAEGHPVTEVKEIKVYTLNYVLNDLARDDFYVDLLTMDIEGLDFAVLKSMDVSAGLKPKVVCVEVRRNMTQAFMTMMQSHRYFCHSRVAENLIFVRNDFEHLMF